MTTLPKLVAHRGYTLHYPENTLLGLEAAIQAGAGFLEVDVQLSKDGVPYLFHDRNLERLCGQPGALHDYSAVELGQFRASDPQRFGYKFADNPLTSLIGLVGLMQRFPDVTVFVELKRSSLEKFGHELVIRKVMSILEPVRSKCVIISYNIEALAHVCGQYHWPVGAVIDEWRERNDKTITDLNPQFLFCDLETLPKKGRIKHFASRIAVFECTDPALALALHRRGVEFVETFAIGEMQQQVPLLAAQ